MPINLKAGNRVKFTRAWLEQLSPSRYERARVRRGAVTRNPQHPMARYVYVKWDDAKNDTMYAPAFIEIDWDALRESVKEQFPKTLECLSTDTGSAT